MTIREAKIEDMEQIETLAEKYGLSVPYDGKLIVAEDNGVIKAFVNIRIVTMIEPFISESPTIGKKLWDYIERKIQKKQFPIIRCFTKQKNEKLFTKLGFSKVFESEITMEKIYREV